MAGYGYGNVKFTHFFDFSKIYLSKVLFRTVGFSVLLLWLLESKGTLSCHLLRILESFNVVDDQNIIIISRKNFHVVLEDAILLLRIETYHSIE